MSKFIVAYSLKRKSRFGDIITGGKLRSVVAKFDELEPATALYHRLVAHEELLYTASVAMRLDNAFDRKAIVITDEDKGHWDRLDYVYLELRSTEG